MEMLLNQKATKKFIKEKCDELREAWGCERVADSALRELNYRLGLLIKSAVRHHPTIGKTFKEI